jgi:hypothetical protein
VTTGGDEHRRSIADALVAVTPVLLKGRKAGTDAKAFRNALHKWTFTVAATRHPLRCRR